ncbi:MAG: hypothetical protein JXN59_14900 [Anaerolineae bacterium]|nr:hypothetical protein [Anaerolineae bacterium]
MATITDRQRFAKTISQGVRAVADRENRKVGSIEEDLANQVMVAVRTLRSWKTPREVPGEIDTGRLVGLAWLLITQGSLSLDWLCELFAATDFVLTDNASRGLLLDFFRLGVVDGKALDDDAINRAIDSLLAGREPEPAESDPARTLAFASGRATGILAGIVLVLVTVVVAVALGAWGRTPDANVDPLAGRCTEPVDKAGAALLFDQGFSLYTPNADEPLTGVASAISRTVRMNARGMWVGYMVQGEGVSGFSVLTEHKQWVHCTDFAGEDAPPFTVNDFVFRGDDIYVATDGLGIVWIHGPEWTIYDTEYGLPSNTVYDLYEDAQGELWAATYEGVARLAGRRWEVIYRAEPEGLSGNHVHLMLDDNAGNRWFGLTFDGLSCLAADGTWTAYFPEYAVRDAAVDGAAVWFATDGNGLLRYADEAWTVFDLAGGALPSDHVQTVELDMYGRVWAGTDGGVVYSPDGGATWIAHSGRKVMDITFGCEGCGAYDERDMWLAVAGEGLGHVTIPPLSPTLRVARAPERVTLAPGEQYVFEVEVEVLDEDLAEGDGLFSNDPAGTPTYGAWPIIPVKDTIARGQRYVFTNIDDPIEAPEEPGDYALNWRVWQNGRFTTDVITVAFTVAAE